MDLTPQDDISEILNGCPIVRYAAIHIIAFAIGLVANTALAEGLFSQSGSHWERFSAVDRQLKKQNPDYRSTGQGLPSYHGNYRGPYLNMARAAARRHGIPEDLFLRLVEQESGWRPHAESNKGAYGLAQLMPRTAHELRVDPTDPFQNLDGGARYLRQQYNRFQDWKLALASYNAGPEAVQRHNGIPPFTETQNYVRQIWEN